MNMMILGEPLLQHLYIVYDFENDQIQLGVNVQSKDQVRIYSAAGKAPAALTELSDADAAAAAAADMVK